ncbi:MAG: DNA-binding response regulator [Balneolaceae bacterium]|nr:MAG: DNA-binding response regulator [Balneolaceae bacterium]
MKNGDKQPGKSIHFEEAFRCYLTKTEIRVVKLINEGLSGSEIADRLGNKRSTVFTHRKNIKRKLNLKGNRSLERWCRTYAGKIRDYSY